MDTASQPAPPRRRTPRRTYTATRVSHPNYSRFTCRTAELPSPLTHLWRPPAIAGAGGHAQVDSGTPYRGRGQARARRPGSFVARPGRARTRSAHRPSAAVVSSPCVMGPACTPAATHHDPSVLAPVKAARAQPSHRQPAKSPAFAGHPLVVTSTPVSWGHTPGPLTHEERDPGGVVHQQREGVTFRPLQGVVPGTYNQEYSCHEKFSESRPR